MLARFWIPYHSKVSPTSRKLASSRCLSLVHHAAPKAPRLSIVRQNIDEVPMRILISMFEDPSGQLLELLGRA